MDLGRHGFDLVNGQRGSRQVFESRRSDEDIVLQTVQVSMNVLFLYVRRQIRTEYLRLPSTY